MNPCKEFEYNYTKSVSPLESAGTSRYDSYFNIYLWWFQSVLRKGYLKEMIQVLSDPRYGSNLAQVDATVKKHEAISADILAR